MVTIVIDPGHGLPDPGAVGPTGLTEEAVALDVSLRLEKLLEKPGRRIVLTRRDHNAAGDIPANLRTLKAISNWSLQNRVDMARINNADLFVSVHANSAPRRDAHGFEMFHNAQGRKASDSVFSAMKARLKSHQPRRSAPARFFVLRKNPKPAILVELEFICNPEQERIFRKPESRDFYARTVALGIEDWLLDFAKLREGN